MSQLKKAQQAMVAYFDDKGDLPEFICQSSEEQPLDVYKGSILGNHLAAFADVYPVIKRLVGEQFFEYAFIEFKRSHPNYHYDISNYGSQFCEFLADFKPCEAYPYLSDVAKLEWLCHQACLSKGDPVCDFAALSGFDSQTLSKVSFTLPKSASLLKSKYPILEIYNQNQPKVNPKNIDLGQAGDSLLIYQKNLDLMIAPLTEHEHECLRLFKNQHTIEKMLYDLSNKYCLSEQACQEMLSKMIQRGWLVGFNVLE